MITTEGITHGSGVAAALGGGCAMRCMWGTCVCVGGGQTASAAGCLLSLLRCCVVVYDMQPHQQLRDGRKDSILK